MAVVKTISGFDGDWFYRARPARNGVYGYCAWRAKVPELGDGPVIWILWNTGVQVAFAPTPEDAIAKLWREMAY